MRERLNVSTTTTARHTVNYDLPQWNGEDVTSWLVNLNDAFNKIDSAMWSNHTAMAGYDKIASDLQQLANDLQVDNSEIRETLGIIQRGMAEQLAQLNQAKQDIANANIAITQLQQEDNVLRAMVEDLQDDVGMLGIQAARTKKVVFNSDTALLANANGTAFKLTELYSTGNIVMIVISPTSNFDIPVTDPITAYTANDECYTVLVNALHSMFGFDKNAPFVSSGIGLISGQRNQRNMLFAIGNNAASTVLDIRVLGPDTTHFHTGEKWRVLSWFGNESNVEVIHSA